MPLDPDTSDGPQRFIRDWLTFSGRQMVSARRVRWFIAAVAALLLASALLAASSHR